MSQIHIPQKCFFHLICGFIHQCFLFFQRLIGWHFIKKNTPILIAGMQFTPTIELPNPDYSLASKWMVQLLEQKNLAGKNVLIFNCGIGHLAAIAAKQKAIVFIYDKNPLALDVTLKNCLENNLKTPTLFNLNEEKKSQKKLDWLIFTPPTNLQDLVLLTTKNMHTKTRVLVIFDDHALNIFSQFEFGFSIKPHSHTTKWCYCKRFHALEFGVAF